jgi:putative ABC transport system permease protein
MRHLRTILSEFIADIKGQKLRAFLTVFGIVWGTVAIVVLLAFGMGFKRQLASNMHGMGESIAIMFPGATTKPFEGFGIGRPVTLVEDDAWLLKSRIRDIKEICPEYSSMETPVRLGENIINTAVGGVFPVYGQMRNIIPELGGRFVDDIDMRDRRRVVVLGDEVKRLLFGEGQAIGRVVSIGQVPFTVVGVMIKKVQPSSYNRRDQDRVFIPASTFTSVFGARHINNIIFTSKDPRQSDETIQEVRQVLGKRYKFDPTDRDAIYIWDTSEIDRFMFYFFLAFNIFMGLIGSFTLAVGGIGVANIMFIVVQERIREIGIKRAVGAKQRDILLQFFAETLFLMGIGAAIGFIFALIITRGMQYIPIKDYVGTPEISPLVAVATGVILTLIGLTAGFMPARKAARLNVVDCLRA